MKRDKVEVLSKRLLDVNITMIRFWVVSKRTLSIPTYIQQRNAITNSIRFTRECFVERKKMSFARKTESDKKSPFEGQAMELTIKHKSQSKRNANPDQHVQQRQWRWLALETVENCASNSRRREFYVAPWIIRFNAIVCERNSTIAHKTPSLDGAGGVRGWHGMEDGTRSEMKNTLRSFYTVNGL